MMNGEKLELIRRVLESPVTFDTDDAVNAIMDIVVDDVDPFDDDYWSDVCQFCGDKFASPAEAMEHEANECGMAPKKAAS